MPLKQAVLPLLDEVSELARGRRRANTVVLRDGRQVGRQHRRARMVAALRESGRDRPERPVVLGGGATPGRRWRARRAGARTPVLVVRSAPHDTMSAAERLGVVRCWRRTTRRSCGRLRPARQHAAAGRPTRWPARRRRPGAARRRVRPVADAVAAACDGTVVSGAAMLLHQAAAQVELMTGRTAPLEAMRRALALKR
jgi:shikimate dehydrogenase